MASLTADIIDVDAYEPEITVTAQGRRVTRAIILPPAQRKSDYRQMPRQQVKTRTATPKTKAKTNTPTIIDLTLSDEDDEPRPVSPMKVGPPRGVKPTSSTPARSASVRSRSSWAASASRHSVRPPERTSTGGQEDEDWETLHDGLNINSESNWNNPIPPPTEQRDGERDSRKELEDAQEAAQDSVLSYLKSRARNETRSVHKPHGEREKLKARPRHPLQCEQIARILGRPENRAGRGNPRKYAYDSTRRTHSEHTRNISHFANARESRHFNMLPGAVNSISQSGKLTAITSCVSGGITRSHTADIPYNREGTLVVMYEDKSMQLSGHRRPDVNYPNSMKYFSVSEAIFDPIWSEYLWSCGEDGRLIQWDCTGMKDGNRPDQLESYSYPVNSIPGGLSLDPQGSSLAVMSNRSEVYLHKLTDLQSPSVFHAAPEPHRHRISVQNTTWGTGSTAGHLFITSAVDDWLDIGEIRPEFYGGYHRMFDTGTGQMIWELKNKEPGESIAFDPRGNTLALALAPATYNIGKRTVVDPITNRPGEVGVFFWSFRFMLELYDVRVPCTRPMQRPAQRTLLPVLPDVAESIDLGVKPRLNDVSWSPDGTYIAVARSDNRTQVFDARALARGALYDFAHAPATEGMRIDGMYGVNKAEWVEDARCGLGLVTSGADGCVRLWDVHRSRGESTVLAQSTNYVSWFCLGDTSKGEHAVVLGDGGGTVVTRG